MVPTEPLPPTAEHDDWRERAAVTDRLAPLLAKARIQLKRLLHREWYATVQLTELVNEVFTKWKGRTEFANTTHFLARVQLDGACVLKDRGRARGRAKRGSRPHMESLDEARHRDALIVEEQRRLEMTALLNRAISRLDPQDAAVVCLRREGHSFGEIAGKLGLTERTARSRFDAVQQLLKARLAKESYGR